jgi:uncharacterized protein YrrD
MSQTIVLGSPVQCSDTKERLALLHPRVSGVVLDPSATHLAYLLVHRGLLGGHDQCVPAGDIGAATPEGVRLTISTEALKALPALEAKVAGRGYIQRSIPQDSLVLGKGIPVADDSGQALGHFSGVVMGSERRIEHILVDHVAAPAIPIDQLSTCTEDGLLVRRDRDAVGGGGQQPRMP